MPQATRRLTAWHRRRCLRPEPGSSVRLPNQAAAIIEPQIFGSAPAWSSCRAREVTGSCQSSVDTRP